MTMHTQRQPHRNFWSRAALAVCSAGAIALLLPALPMSVPVAHAQNDRPAARPGGGQRDRGPAGGRRGDWSRGRDQRPGQGNRGDRLREFERLRREDPEAFAIAKELRQVEKAADELAAKYERADSNEEKELIAKELRRHLDRAFELRTKLRERKLKELEKRLEKARNDLALRKKNKAQIIDDHFKRITGQTSYMNW